MIETLLLQDLSPCPVMAEFLSSRIHLDLKSDLGCQYLSIYRAALRGLLRILSAYRLTPLTLSKVIPLLSCNSFRNRPFATLCRLCYVHTVTSCFQSQV